jgi:hypothetical protein
MISSVRQSNNLQNLTNLNISKYAPKKDSSQTEVVENLGINTKSNNNMLQKLDLVELRKYAELAGESNITDDDIRYGLIYGRSVIADYLA